MRAVICEMPDHWLAELKRFRESRDEEMWEGVLHVSPMPNRPHQDLEGQLLAYLLYQWAYPTGNRVNQQVNLTTPEDEADWVNNYRVPDLVILRRANFHIDKIEYMAGAPDVVVEIRSPGDESYEKLDFYAGLGVPEVWIIHRNVKTLEIFLLQEDGTYETMAAQRDGWYRSPAVGLEMKRAKGGKLSVRMKGKPRSQTEIPR